MGLSLPLQAKSGLIGQNKIWLRVQDNAAAVAAGSDDQGYILSGTWEVKAPAPPRSPSTPSAGNS
ncbi:MAG: hypothetical protein EOO38_16420 [Cytophagaceae bacterium]|nr:MAG: hypothetical protein EOO38_16420 [Cytophagaceae bacterium]